MLVDMDWRNRWKPGPGTGFTRKGLVFLVTLTWLSVCCVLSLKHANKICSGGHSQADLDPKVWDEVVQVCRHSVWSAARMESFPQIGSAGLRGRWALAVSRIIYARQDIVNFALATAGFGLVWWVLVFLVHFVWQGIMAFKHARLQGSANMRPPPRDTAKGYFPHHKDLPKQPLPNKGGSGVATGQRTLNIAVDAMTGGAQGHTHLPPPPPSRLPPSPPQNTGPAFDPSSAVPAGPSSSGAPDVPTCKSIAASDASLIGASDFGFSIADDSDAPKAAAAEGQTGPSSSHAPPSPPPPPPTPPPSKVAGAEAQSAPLTLPPGQPSPWSFASTGEAPESSVSAASVEAQTVAPASAAFHVGVTISGAQPFSVADDGDAPKAVGAEDLTPRSLSPPPHPLSPPLDVAGDEGQSSPSSSPPPPPYPPQVTGDPTAPPAGEETTPLPTENTSPNPPAEELNHNLDPPTGDHNPTARTEAPGTPMDAHAEEGTNPFPTTSTAGGDLNALPVATEEERKAAGTEDIPAPASSVHAASLEEQSFAPGSAPGAFSFGASSSGSIGFGATSFGASSSGFTSFGATNSGAPSSGPTGTSATSSGSTGFGATNFGAPSSGATGFGGTSFGASSIGGSGSGKSAVSGKTRGRKGRGKAAAPAPTTPSMPAPTFNAPLTSQMTGPLHGSLPLTGAGLSSLQHTQGLPEQLDLGWLHTLAGQVPGPAFIPPTCDFELLEGPHSEAVMKVTTQQCNALELASSRLVACGIHTVALDLASQALGICYSWSLSAAALGKFHCCRARIFSTIGMPVSAFMEHIRAAQSDVTGMGCVEVANQLARWGLIHHMHSFGEQFQAAYGAQHAGWRHPHLPHCLTTWTTQDSHVQKVLLVDLEVFTPGDEAGEAHLQQLKGLTHNWPGHQPLACRKALLELRLGKPADALRTAHHFVGVAGGECAPAQWALHLSAHAYWLQGQLPSACVSLDRAAAMQPSWLEQESRVGYALPPLDVIQQAQALLRQLTQSWTDIQRDLAKSDVQSASTALDSLRQAQRASGCASMSPGCCAQQLLHEASIHCGWANQPGAVGVQCVRGLTACELAVAMEPDLWWQALQLQNWLLDRLMAYAAKHRLLEEVLNEKRTQLTPEQAEFFNKNIPQAGAMSYGLMQAGGGNLHYPDLFGVQSPATSESEVKRSGKALMRICHTDSAGRPFIMAYADRLAGLGSVFSLGQEAEGRRRKVSHTLNLVQSAVTDLFPESAVRSSGFETDSGAYFTPGPAPSPNMPNPAPAPADSQAQREGVVLQLEAAGSQQEASASRASGAAIAEGSGPSMPAPESRADEPGRAEAEAAPEAAASFLNSDGHQPVADSDVPWENSDDLPDYESE